MPGYFVHIGSASDDVRSSALGLKGLIAPDLWKKHTPTESEYLQFFEGCPDAPSYEQVKLLCSAEHGGTHFGSKPSDTNHADFAFISDLFESGKLDANNLFFKGYVHHLRVDKNFYADASLCDAQAFENDRVINNEAAMAEKVQKVIAFAEGSTKYVFLTPMKKFIQDMRKPRSLEELLNG